ncbi:MAG: PhzF family phenazine biosynthesis protein [Bacteroidota bacterium]
MPGAVETFIVDSFTDRPFRGNPAGVCLLKAELTEELMLAIAQELGLSETAFVVPYTTANKLAIRYFSPKMEIPLCGHATLAAAKVLFEKDDACKNLQFITKQHIDLLITRREDKIQMTFPVYRTQPATVPPALLTALGLNEHRNAVYNQETNILLLEIADSRVLQALEPDFTALVQAHDTINGVLVTAPSQRKGFDFESRYFWPWSGTNEDPATGGTHTFLTGYWSERLGKTKLNSFQCSARTGFMEVELLDEDRLVINSTARIVLQGVLWV